MNFGDDYQQPPGSKAWLFLVVAAALVYGAVAYVPVVKDYLTVRDEAQELARRLQRPSANRSQATARFVRRVRRATGIEVTPAMIKTEVNKRSGKVEVEVRLKTSALFPLLKKGHPLSMTIVGSARGEMSNTDGESRSRSDEKSRSRSDKKSRSRSDKKSRSRRRSRARRRSRRHRR